MSSRIFAGAAGVLALALSSTVVASGGSDFDFDSRSCAMSVPTTQTLVVRLKQDEGRNSAITTARLKRDVAGLGVDLESRGAMALGYQKLRLHAANPRALELAIAKIASSQGVIHAEVDHPVHALWAPSDASWAEHLPNLRGNGIRMQLAWDRSRGDGTVIAVVDTGITYHPDLAENILPGYDFSNAPQDANALDEGDEGYIFCNPLKTLSSWHGTHVAGIAAAVANNVVNTVRSQENIVGVAPEAGILPLRVINRDGGHASSVADAIVWAAGGDVPQLDDEGEPEQTATGEPVYLPRNQNIATVINISLGSEVACMTYMADAIAYATEQGVTVVASAGNSAKDAATIMPANCPNVISVGATDSTGQLAEYSNRGSRLHVAAPGSDILSTVDIGRSGPIGPDYEGMSGTSMAAPHVSGVVALMQALYPRTPAEVKSIVVRTALSRPIDCTLAEGPVCTVGVLDAAAATGAAMTWPTAKFNVQHGVCPGNIYTFVNLSKDPQGPDGLTASWDFGNGITSTDWRPSLTLPPGARLVTLKVMDAQGHYMKLARNVTVNSCP